MCSRYSVWVRQPTTECRHLKKQTNNNPKANQPRHNLYSKRVSRTTARVSTNRESEIKWNRANGKNENLISRLAGRWIQRKEMFNAKVLSLKGTSPRRHYVSKKEEDPWEKHENLLKTCTTVTNKCVRILWDVHLHKGGENLYCYKMLAGGNVLSHFAKHSRVFSYKAYFAKHKQWGNTCIWIKASSSLWFYRQRYADVCSSQNHIL